jgi:hypothetical protein
MPAKYKPKKEDRARVKLMAAAGIMQNDIAAKMAIAPKTLRLHFREELTHGMLDITTLAVGQLVSQIQKGNLGAICFWLKTRAGWRETERLEHIGENGGPVTVKVVYEDRPARST